MEIALLLLVAAMQVATLALLIASSRGQPVETLGPADLEDALARVSAETVERLETLREDLGALLSGVRESIEAAADARTEGDAAVSGRTDPAEEVRDRLREALAAFDARLDDLAERISGWTRVPEAEAVARSLRRRGFERIVLLDRVAEEGGGERVGVEARRGGMLYKGWVAVSGGEITREELAPAHRMFP